MSEKKIIFFGSRFHVLNELLLIEDASNIIIYALQESILEKILNDEQIAFHSFSLDKKKEILNYLSEVDFDILISNGCPIIFPVDRFKNHQILINIHPTYLPHLQGKTPLNGVFYYSYNFYGATMHYMDKGIDTGAIISQKKVTLTSDIDLGLLYHLAMKLEGTVFKQGWKKLKQANFNYVGKKQKGKHTYFNRTIDKQSIDFKTQTTKELLRTIKSFGIESQGSFSILDNVEYKIMDAENIVHKPLLSMYGDIIPGKIILSYDGKLLVKTIDGIIKITRYSAIE